MDKEHTVHVDNTGKNRKDSLLKRYNKLVSTIRNQKMTILNDIYKLKQEETKKKEKCKCKGNFCVIDHDRFRWTCSKADRIFNKLTTSVSVTDSENVHISVKEDNHAEMFLCHDCDKTFLDENTLTSHRETEHINKILESTFINPSLLNSTDC